LVDVLPDGFAPEDFAPDAPDGFAPDAPDGFAPRSPDGFVPRVPDGFEPGLAGRAPRGLAMGGSSSRRSSVRRRPDDGEGLRGTRHGTPCARRVRWRRARPGRSVQERT
jgi:hypothetical protein